MCFDLKQHFFGCEISMSPYSNHLIVIRNCRALVMMKNNSKYQRQIKQSLSTTLVERLFKKLEKVENTSTLKIAAKRKSANKYIKKYSC